MRPSPAQVKGAMRLMEPADGPLTLFKGKELWIRIDPEHRDYILVQTAGMERWRLRARLRRWHFRVLQEALKEMELIDVEG